ncbi:Uncharacterized protein DAT39_020563, partial [Clarias magur]
EIRHNDHRQGSGRRLPEYGLSFQHKYRYSWKASRFMALDDQAASWREHRSK